MKIWTIGHSTRALSEFVAALHSQDIKALADVRKLPGSRRFPHFDQAPLAAALQREGIDYHHFPKLSGRRKPRSDSRNTAWRNSAFRAYADHMESAEFAGAVSILTDLAVEQRTVMMCAEAVWWRCHRSLIADFLKARGWRVLHILSAQKIEEHPFTSAARIVNGELSYETPQSASG